MQRLFVGGLAGFIRGAGAGTSQAFLVDADYRQGSILIWNNTGSLRTGGAAGGFFGSDSNTTNNSVSLYRCFVAGNVIAQRNSTRTIYAGGLIGQKTRGGTLQNNAALGASITVTNTSTNSTTRYIGRILGGYDTGYEVTLTGNRAFNGMRLLQSGIYSDGNPQGSTVSTGAADNKDGLDANLGNFHDRSFWGNVTGSAGLGFNSATVWIFSTVESRGHPILRGAPLLGGGINPAPLGGQ